MLGRKDYTPEERASAQRSVAGEDGNPTNDLEAKYVKQGAGA